MLNYIYFLAASIQHKLWLNLEANYLIKSMSLFQLSSLALVLNDFPKVQYLTMFGQNFMPDE